MYFMLNLLGKNWNDQKHLLGRVLQVVKTFKIRLRNQSFNHCSSFIDCGFWLGAASWQSWGQLAKFLGKFNEQYETFLRRVGLKGRLHLVHEQWQFNNWDEECSCCLWSYQIWGTLQEERRREEERERQRWGSWDLSGACWPLFVRICSI